MRFALLLVGVASLLAGCTTSTVPPSDGSSTSDTPAPSTAEPGSESRQSIVESITVDTPPEMICRAFIECLRCGDAARAEKLMSQESITQTRKHALDLAMPAGPNASYSVGVPQYATSQQKIAFVSIDVHDPEAADANTQSFSMMLRNGNFGWKISGIMLGAEGTDQDLFSFENPLDVVRIKSMLDGEERQAMAPAESGGRRYQ
jgi:hypothetical protein